MSPATGQPDCAWAVRFPFASPPHYRHWEDRQVTVPAELITTAKGALQPSLIPPSLLAMSVERREGPTRKYEDLREQHARAKEQTADSKEVDRLKVAMEAAEEKRRKHEGKLIALRLAEQYPSRSASQRRTSVSELQDLAAQYTAVPIHPAQLYAAINAFLLSGILSTLFYLRKRHGVVITALCLLYPIPRIALEIIRSDNPHDIAGLTASQFVGLGLFILAIVYLIILYKWLPERSPALDTETSRRENNQPGS
jgi:hypothetical protein